jgi:hypothetical protein
MQAGEQAACYAVDKMLQQLLRDRPLTYMLM